MNNAKPILLTNRDYDLLQLLGNYRFLAAGQVAALLFPSEEGATRRLRELKAHGLVHRIAVAVRMDDDTPNAVWALRGAGASYAATRQGGVRPPFLTPREERTGHFIAHTKARNDFRIVLERLNQVHPKFTLLSWRQEKSEVLRSAVVDFPHGSKRVSFVPDGVAVVRVGHECQVFALETDRATVKPKHMAVRYRAYWRYWREGGARHDYGPSPFRVLTVTTDEKHLARLVAAARVAPDRRLGTKMFWFALQRDVDLARPERLLDPIWTVASRTPMEKQQLFQPRLLS